MSLDKIAAMSPRQRRALLASLLETKKNSAAPPFPLSEGQRAIWYVQVLDPDNSSLNLGEAVRVFGGLDYTALRQALQAVVARHEALRSRVVCMSGEPFQRVIQQVDIPLESLAPCGGSEAAIGEAAGAFIDSHFDLERRPPLRVGTYRCANGDDVLVLALHHLVGEFSSLIILIGELFEFYQAALEDRPPRVEPLRATYADFIRAQAEYLRSPKTIEDGEYWRKTLDGSQGALEFPQRSRSEAEAARSALVSFELGIGLARSVRELSRRVGVSTYVTLLSSFAALLARRRDVRDITIGAPITGRGEARFANVIGYFDNPLPLRVILEDADSVATLLLKMRDVVIGAVEHQAYPLQRIVEDQRAAAKHRLGPMYNTMFVMRQSPKREHAALTAFGMGGSRARATLGEKLDCESLPVSRRRSQFDLALSIAETGESLVGSWEFDRGKFDDESIADLSDALERVLEMFVGTPDAPLMSLPGVSMREEQWLIEGCNATTEDLGPPELLHQAILAQVAIRPDSVALVSPERSMTFRELDQRATRVAEWLLAGGIRPGEHVAVVMEKGWEQVVAVLGVLKAGGAYLPVDGRTPTERRLKLIQRGEVRLALTQQRLLQNGTWPADIAIAAVDTQGLSEDQLPALTIDPEQLAYTIFTSGSTGEPKGVMISHRAAVNTLRDVNRRLAVGHDDSVLGLSSLHFDLSVYDIFGVLGAGGRLVLPDPERLYEPGHWVELVDVAGVTIWNTVPSFLKLTVEHVEGLASPTQSLSSLRAVLLSGDWIPTNLPSRMRKLNEHHRFISMGGATEAAVWSIWFEVAQADPSWRSIPYGRPMTNQTFYVLSERGLPCPVGVPGELYIGGIGVMMGYWRAPDLSERALLRLPNIPGVLYRTGDLGRRNPDGTIEFLGRADFQVKIRGFRVEVGEIEAALLRHPALSGCVVVAQRYGDENRLVAYIVMREVVAIDELRAHAAAELPGYMVPAFWVPISELPLTSNGKVDRKSLPDPESHVASSAAALRAPATEAEKSVASVVEEILACGRVGMDQDLIALGADSIHLIRIAARLQGLGYSVSSRDLFDSTRVDSVAALIASREREGAGASLKSAPTVWSQRQALSSSSAFSVCELVPSLPMESSVVERAWANTIDRYQALRLCVGTEEQTQVERGELSRRKTVRHHADVQAAIEACRREGCELEPSVSLLDGGSLLLAIPGSVADARGFREVVSELGRALTSTLGVALPTHEDSVFWRWIQQTAARECRIVGIANGVPAGVPTRETVECSTTSPPHLRQICQTHRVALSELVSVAIARSGTGISRLAVIEREAHRAGTSQAPKVAPAATDQVLALDTIAAQRGGPIDAIVRLRAGVERSVERGDAALVVTDSTAVRDTCHAAGLSVRNWVDYQVCSRLEATVLSVDQDGETLTWKLERTVSPGTSALLQRVQSELGSLLAELATTPPKARAEDFTHASLSESELARLQDRYPHMLDVLDLSPMQHTMLLHSLMDGSSGLYCHHLYWDVEGAVDAERLRASLAEVVARVPNLRAAFEHEDTVTPVQVVLPAARVPLDVRDVEPNLAMDALRAVVEEDRRTGFDLRRPPLMRGTVLRMTDNRSIIVLCHHHLLLDGWSGEALLKQVLLAYDGVACPNSATADFSSLIDWIRARKLSEYRDYWSRELADVDLPTPLPFDGSHRALGQFRHAEVETRWTDVFSRQLESAARRCGVTPGALLMTAWALVLSKHSRKDDVVFGVTGAGRPESLAGAEHIVGLCTNTIPLRVRVERTESLASAALRVQRQHAASRQYEQASLSELAGFAGVESSAFKPFDTIVVVENYLSDESWTAPDSRLVFHKPKFFEQTNAPIEVYFTPGAEWEARITYDGSRFEPDSISALLDQLRQCLETAFKRPAATVQELTLVTERDRAFFSDLNETGRCWSGPSTLSGLLAYRATVSGESVAIEDGQRSLTYRELHARAQGVAARLMERGVGNGTRVGLLCRRSIELFVAMYGILSAGAAYVPFDQTIPPQRIEMMLRDAAVSVVLVDATTKDTCSVEGVELVLVEAIPEGQASRAAADTMPESAAYVIYTSGSTGTPKGVVVPNGAVTNYAYSASALYGWAEHDRILQFYSPAFDAAGEEIFGALASGATLVLRPEDLLASLETFVGFLERARISAVSIPSAVWHTWVSAMVDGRLAPPRQVRSVVIGGERALPQRLAEWRQCVGATGLRLFNTYGPTEATIVALTSEVTEWNAEQEEGREVPIGRPIFNAKVFVLDEDGQLLPRGVPGELYIGGAGLALGYLGQPELTAERFAEFPGAPGVRLYRTGDRVRFRWDGQLEFLGRVDSQVKVRGYRVELGEVETALARVEGVRQCVVDARVLSGDQLSLVAYVVCDSQLPAKRDQTIGERIRGSLKALLPSYMVPSAIVALDEMPLNRQGKIDRTALPDPRPGGSVEQLALPTSQLERDIARIWGEVLGKEQLRVDEEFLDAGGHSLAALRLVGRIQQEMGVGFSLRALYNAPTVRGIAQLVEAGGEQKSAEAIKEQMRRDSLLPLPEIVPVDHSSSRPPARILVTGATGFVGAALVAALLDSTHAELCCLTRGADRDGEHGRIAAAMRDLSMWRKDVEDRVRVVHGNIELPNLGLSAHDCADLVGSIDVVVHSAARVNFAEPYDLVRAANVLGTLEIIKFCGSGRQKQLHYVSTLGIFDARVADAPIPEREASAECPELHSGYGQTKWVAERLVLRAFDAGLSGVVYRPGRVAGHSQTGAWKPTDVVLTMLEACSAIGSVPELDIMVDLTPVDYVASAVACCVQSRETGRVLHLVNPKYSVLRDVVKMLEAAGRPLALTPLAEWASQIRRATKSAPTHPWMNLLELLLQWHEAMSPPRHGLACYESFETSALLQRRGIECPPTGPKLLGTYMQWVETGTRTRALQEARA